MSVVFPGYSLVSSTNKTDRHDITERLLKMALNTINPSQPTIKGMLSKFELDLCIAVKYVV
jgi:hypothetical protein